MRQKKKWRERSSFSRLGLLFLAVLFGFSVLNLLSRDRVFSEQENRMLEQLPKVRISGILDGKFMRSFENYQTDQFVFRDTWMQIRTASQRLIGKNESGGVYLGEGGQLYEKPVKWSDQVWDNLDALKGFAERHPEVNRYFLLVPDAAAVMPEGLPPYAPVEKQWEQLSGIRSYLGGAFEEISVLETLREHREEYLYYRTDHHWTTLGAYYAFCKAEQVMGLETIGEPEFCELAGNFEGTLSSKSGYRVPLDTISVYRPQEEERLAVTYVEEQEKKASLYASARLDTKDKYGVFLDGNHPVVEIRTMAESNRKLLLVKDSYANCFVPFLTGQFREIVLVDPRYYYGELEELMETHAFTDVLFLYNLNTFLEDNVLHFVLQETDATEG